MKDIDKLVDKAKSGNVRAFEKLYRMTSKEVYWYCRRLCENDFDSEDLLQNVYLTAWQKIEQYKGINFKAWLRSIAHNTFLNQLKKHNEELLNEEVFENIKEDELLGPANIADQKYIRTILLKAIESELTSVQRMTVMMFYYDEMSVGEIASVMECAEGTVKSRLYLSRKKLRDKLEKSGNTLFSCIPCIFPILRYEAEHSRKYPSFFRKSILPHMAGKSVGATVKVMIAASGTLTATVAVLLITSPFHAPVSTESNPNFEHTIIASITDDFQDSTDTTSPKQTSTSPKTATTDLDSVTINTTTVVYTTVANVTSANTDTTIANLQETPNAEPTVTAVSFQNNSDTNPKTIATAFPSIVQTINQTTAAEIITTETMTETITEPVQSYIHESIDGNVHWYIDSDGVIVLEYKNAPVIGDIDDYYQQVANPDPLQGVTKPYLDDIILYAPWNAAANGGDNVNTVKVADSIYSIGGYAFYQLRVDQFEMSDTVTQICKMAFAKSNIGTFTMSAQLKKYENDIFTDASIGKMIYPEGTTDIVGQLLSKASRVTEIELPSTLEVLTSNEFTGCQGLEKITILNADVSFPDEECLPESVVIYGVNGSTAQEYASQNGFIFVPIL